jgi:hypothetical protein
MSTKPNVGEVVETTVRKRVVPATEAKERKPPEFWEYVESLTADAWNNHILYLYRRESDVSGASTFLEKLTGSITLPGGEAVPLTSREELEYGIAKKYGGRIFRLILKNGSERVCETRVYIDQPPKAISAQADPMPGVTVHPASGDPTAAIASEAMRTVASQEGNGLIIAANVLNSAANVVKNLSEKPNGGMQDQLFQALLARVLAPPPDPLETFTRMMALVRELNGGGTNPMMTKVLDAALERILNPALPAGSGPISAGAELVRSLPSIGSTIVSGLQEWRMGMEAQSKAVELMAKNPPPGGAPRAGSVIPPPLPATTAPATDGAQPMHDQQMQFMEQKIVQIFNEPLSGAEAADKCLEFLDTLDEHIVPQLAALGKDGLMQLFQTRPTLKPATSNLGRLDEFLTAFMKYATEPPPPAVSPGAPN